MNIQTFDVPVIMTESDANTLRIRCTEMSRGLRTPITPEELLSAYAKIGFAEVSLLCLDVLNNRSTPQPSAA